jgi:hypothetical protein
VIAVALDQRRGHLSRTLPRSPGSNEGASAET